MLLVIINVAFISLGLPDSLLGSAWPVMQRELGAQTSWAGVLTMITASGTIVSSLMSDRLTRRLGAGRVTAVSVLMTAGALLGFSVSGRFWQLCLLCLPLGLGGGAVDAALNNYVALHFRARHMSWLHCFWGVGASLSPYLMSFALAGPRGWQGGYRIVFFIQAALTAALFLSLPLWQRPREGAGGGGRKALPLSAALAIRGVPLMLVTFFGYCALESTAGLWASSYLVQYRGVDPQTAARYASLFFIGITAGRLLCGFVADLIGDRWLIRGGILGMALGVLMVMLPLRSGTPALVGLVVIGLGGAPIYPAVIHATPSNFGRENSQAIIGIQMASAYLGATLMPPVFGLIAQHISIGLYPYYMMCFAALMLYMSERLNRRLSA